MTSRSEALRFSTPLLLSVAGTIVAAAIGAVVAQLALSSLEPAIIVLIAALLWAPIVYRITQRRFDVFEPVFLVNLSLSYYFLVRPTADLLVGSPFNVEASFTPTLLLVLAGVAAFELGYLLPLGKKLSSALPIAPAPADVGRLVGFAAVLTIVAAGLFAAFIVVSGGTSVLAVLGAGRSPAASSVYGSTTGYLYDGPALAIPACLVLLALALTHKRHRLLFFILSAIPAALAFVTAFPQGNRSSLLALLLPGIALPFVIHHRRPRWFAILLAALVFLTAGSYIGQNRNAATDPASQSSSLTQFWITGTEGSEFDILAVELQQMPSPIAFSPGATVVDLATRAVPRVIWPDKPLERSDALTASLFPRVYFSFKTDLLPSMVGILYMDSGLISVLLGMMALGILLKTLWEYFQRHSHSLFAQILYVTFLPLSFLLMRDSPAQTMSGLIFTAAPLVLMFWFARSRARDSGQGAATAPTADRHHKPVAGPGHARST